MFGGFRNVAHFKKVSDLLRYECKIDSNRLCNLTEPKLFDICADAREKGINAEATAAIWLMALLKAVQDFKIHCDHLNFVWCASALDTWGKSGRVSVELVDQFHLWGAALLMQHHPPDDHRKAGSKIDFDVADVIANVLDETVEAGRWKEIPDFGFGWLDKDSAKFGVGVKIYEPQQQLPPSKDMVRVRDAAEFDECWEAFKTCHGRPPPMIVEILARSVATAIDPRNRTVHPPDVQHNSPPSKLDETKKYHIT